jgi:hypothetical protein
LPKKSCTLRVTVRELNMTIESEEFDGNKFHTYTRFGNGEMLSIQASSFHYSSPRKDNAESYSAVEVCNFAGIELPASWDVYKSIADDGVYVWVPAEMIAELIWEKRGDWIDTQRLPVSLSVSAVPLKVRNTPWEN